MNKEKFKIKSLFLVHVNVNYLLKNCGNNLKIEAIFYLNIIKTQ